MKLAARWAITVAFVIALTAPALARKNRRVMERRRKRRGRSKSKLRPVSKYFSIARTSVRA
jgi:alkanesulfonate monooxygenase SsuD/methylene tetrahydromethanopterin reductase-like flavin-dependent oxidoreductase (luciferase family)